MEWICAAIVLGLVALLAWQAWMMDRERDRNRAHIERLERLLKARDAGEAAAFERAFASPQPKADRKPAPPSEEEQMFADPPRRKDD